MSNGMEDCMRKMRKGIVLFLFLVLSITTLTGCGGGEEEENKFVGTWNMTAGKVNGVSLPADQVKEQLGTISFVIQKGGTVKKEGIGLDATGKWEEKSNGIVVSDKDGSNEVVFTLEEDTLSGEIKGIEILFKKV